MDGDAEKGVGLFDREPPVAESAETVVLFHHPGVVRPKEFSGRPERVLTLQGSILKDMRQSGRAFLPLGWYRGSKRSSLVGDGRFFVSSRPLGCRRSVDMELIYQKFTRERLSPAGVLEAVDFDIPKDFNFGFDVVDALAKKCPEKTALLHLDRGKAGAAVQLFGDLGPLQSGGQRAGRAGDRKGRRGATGPPAELAVLADHRGPAQAGGRGRPGHRSAPEKGLRLPLPRREDQGRSLHGRRRGGRAHRGRPARVSHRAGCAGWSTACGRAGRTSTP